MKAMLLRRPGAPLEEAELPDPVAGPGPGAPPRAGVRRLPHRPPRRATASSATRSCPSSSATRSSPRWSRAQGGSRPATASVSPGSAGRVGAARTASPAARTSAIPPGSPDTTWTAATRSSASPTSGSASRFRADLDDVEAAPLLCAGLIGFRSLRLAGDAARIGLYGFGAAAHIVCQVAVAQGRTVHALTRPGDDEAQAFARSLGADVGGRHGRRAAGRARRGDPVRAGGRARAARARPRREGRHGRVRRDPHERHPVVPVRAALGRAGRPLGCEPHACRRRGVPRAGARACRCGRRSRRCRSPRRTRRSSACARAPCAARSSSSRDR